jgi:hypothetical protein
MYWGEFIMRRSLILSAVVFSVAALESVGAQGLPDLKVTSVSGTFVAYEAGPEGSAAACIGPFMDFTVVVTNLGSDFPAPADLKVNRSRMIDEPEATMLYFNLHADMDFGAGPGSGGQHVIAIDKSKVPGGILKSGASLEVPLHLRIFDNQTSVRIDSWVIGGFMLKVANGKSRSESYNSGAIEIPIWDLYTVSSATLQGTTEKGENTIDTKTTIINRGKSPTPGPVVGSLAVEYEDKAPTVPFNIKSPGPLGAGESTEIYVRTPAKGLLHKPFKVYSSLQAHCPNGEYGDLADGNRADNSRRLEEQ